MNKPILKNISDKEFSDAVKESISLFDLSQKLGFSKSGFGKMTRNKAKDRIKKLGLKFKEKIRENKNKNSVSNITGENKSRTRIIGTISELKVQTYLMENGFDVCLPIADTLPFDILAIKENKFYKIQVKYGSVNNDVATIKLSNTHYVSSKGKWQVHFYKKEDVDIFALVCGSKGIAFIPNEENIKDIYIYTGNDSLKGPKQKEIKELTLEKAISKIDK